jgi:hypothetical protein
MGGKMRRMLVLSVGTAMAALMVASRVALAATISCPNKSGNLCVGTINRDTMTGRDRADTMRGKAGGDKMSGLGGADEMLGQPGDLN